MAQEYTGQGSDNGADPVRPAFHIGQHDSTRYNTLTNIQYGQVLNTGVSPAFSSSRLQPSSQPDKTYSSALSPPLSPTLTSMSAY
ncbi:hypothetical protein NPX13_g10177 [Xylaria arbuscula]|uniref:Uncharacterized protein n=1 Tax=Xylaria arbuscula TaxID=114810 RepID=A0A9W8N5B4_9PEZI|nr:hypothetical protein NPX13_g10177 [Xylaria arbuscula]